MFFFVPPGTSVGRAVSEDRHFCELFGALHDHPDGVGHARQGLPAPQEERAQASAVDAVFFEVLSEGGPRLRRHRRVEGCHQPQDNVQVGLALY